MIGITNLEILSDESGRWGNQLFRIATMIGYASKYGCDYYIPSEWAHLKYFNFNRGVSELSTILSNIKNLHIQRGFHYENIPYLQSGILDTRGYFQSYKYFENSETEVYNEFMSNVELIQDAKSKYNFGNSTLCIHIRHGDNFDRARNGGHVGNEHYHPVMTISYYNNAMKMLVETLGVDIDKIFIFTDHITTKNFIYDKINTYNIATEYIDYKENFVYDFFAQSMCDHFIIPNSSFSWWSSYLGRNPNKVVCCPQETDWFGAGYGHYNMNDLLPLSWVRIPQ